MSYRLRDGSETKDIRLDRLVQFDQRSRLFPVRNAVGTKPIRSYTWTCPVWLDQLNEGACVGFSLMQKMAARYAMIKEPSTLLARRLYKRAQQLDEWTGEAYEGTSILGGMKAAVDMGFIKGYVWSFSLKEALLAIAYGGGVMGCNWYEGMTQTDAKGFIHPTGDIVGGHAIFVRGVTLYAKPGAPAEWRSQPDWINWIDMDKSFVRLRNSWGKFWGVNGDCFLSVRDFDRLLKEQGEFCIPVRK